MRRRRARANTSRVHASSDTSSAPTTARTAQPPRSCEPNERSRVGAVASAAEEPSSTFVTLSRPWPKAPIRATSAGGARLRLAVRGHEHSRDASGSEQRLLPGAERQREPNELLGQRDVRDLARDRSGDCGFDAAAQRTGASAPDCRPGNHVGTAAGGIGGVADHDRGLGVRRQQAGDGAPMALAPPLVETSAAGASDNGPRVEIEASRAASPWARAPTGGPATIRRGRRSARSLVPSLAGRDHGAHAGGAGGRLDARAHEATPVNPATAKPPGEGVRARCSASASSPPEPGARCG